MDRLQSILVAVDFTPGSAAALRQAIRIARWNKATLRAVHVMETSVVEDLERALSGKQTDVRNGLIRGARENWQDFIADVPDSGDIELIVEIDHAVSGVLRVSESHKADLIVLGAHGNSPRQQGAGTTAIAVARRSHKFVLLVHDSDAVPFKSIVACVDFSHTSRKALAQAIHVAVQDNAALHVLHVFDAPWHRLHYRTETAEASPDFQKQYRDGLREQLELFYEPCASEFPNVKPKFHLMDYASHGGGIIKFALEHKVDLVVLGTRGRTNLRDILMGSTAERVLRDTPCSTLTVKPEG